MKRIYFVTTLTLLFAFTSCSWLMTDAEIDKKIYFIELIDSARTVQSPKLIKTVYSQLQNKEFVGVISDKMGSNKV